MRAQAAIERGIVGALGLTASVAAIAACGSGGGGERPDPSTAARAAKAPGRRGMSGSVVTSWEAQSRLPYHLVERPYVEFRDAEYLVTVRFNRRLSRVPKRDRTFPEQGGKEGPTRASMLLNEHGGDIWPGLATISYEQPCYSRNFGQGDGRSMPPLFPPREGRLVIVTLRVPGQPWIAVRTRARRSSEARAQVGARHLGCKVWQVSDEVG